MTLKTNKQVAMISVYLYLHPKFFFVSSTIIVLLEVSQEKKWIMLVFSSLRVDFCSMIRSWKPSSSVFAMHFSDLIVRFRISMK